jgi:hypothetical protein
MLGTNFIIMKEIEESRCRRGIGYGSKGIRPGGQPNDHASGRKGNATIDGALGRRKENWSDVAETTTSSYATPPIAGSVMLADPVSTRPAQRTSTSSTLNETSYQPWLLPDRTTTLSVAPAATFFITEAEP